MEVSTCLLVLLVPSLVLCEEGCYERPAVQNFDFTAFHGEWNFLMVNWITGINKCIQQTFTETNGNSSISMNFADRIEDKTVSLIYRGPIWQSSNTPGKLHFILPDEAPEIVLPYWVLDTDYQNYAVTNFCWLQNAIGRDYITVLSRTTSLTPEAWAAVNATIERFNIDTFQMVQVPHTDCP